MPLGERSVEHRARVVDVTFVQPFRILEQRNQYLAPRIEAKLVAERNPVVGREGTRERQTVSQPTRRSGTGAGWMGGSGRGQGDHGNN